MQWGSRKSSRSEAQKVRKLLEGEASVTPIPARTHRALPWGHAHFPASRCTAMTRCESGAGVVGQRAGHRFFSFPPRTSPRHPHSDMRPCCALRQRYTMPCCLQAATPASARTVCGFKNDVIRTRLPHAPYVILVILVILRNDWGTRMTSSVRGYPCMHGYPSSSSSSSSSPQPHRTRMPVGAPAPHAARHAMPLPS
jgi:hypothetical protein